MENFDDKKKKVDEAWKEAVQKERKEADTRQQAGAQEEYPQEINFGLFLSSLMIEGLIALGDVENPATKKSESNLGHARYVIDIIAMLQEKTKNNLTADEKTGLEQILYELRMRYIAKNK